MKARNPGVPSNVRRYCKKQQALSLEACKIVGARFSHLRERMVRKSAARIQEPGSEHLVQQAVAEAEALAWSTPYPLLFLPGLAEEKVAGAMRWADHQRAVLERQKALEAIL